MVVNTSLLPDHNSMSDRSKMIAIDDSIVFGEVSRFLCNDCGLDFKKRFGSFKFNWMEPFNNTEFLMFGEEVIKVVKSLDVMDYARRKQIVVKLEPQNPQIRQLFQRTHHLSSWLNTHEEVILKSNMKILQFMKIHTFDNKCENEIFQNFENAERVESLKRKDRTKRKLLGWYTKPKQPQFDM
ncbi:hypothetical protein EIN_063070 [Entamoeba invadens IP1]|uniref:hypothetical protein n=1 Tax=Entamoeba invadens IP1 TaxID=370355 RepID=UPI0002C3F1B7|nr:hypothetical protein EIN_063070 [Entamoeba invadens IP1]ELP93592.1 hypothetical protein EIN_063070 [Entamoeba invadens IP1]|eukprot:XP_004260363.1 hypothetical protein EIN_063070 [Entamoeba invadens IP1]